MAFWARMVPTLASHHLGERHPTGPVPELRSRPEPTSATVATGEEKDILPKDILVHAVKLEGEEIDAAVLKIVESRDRRTDSEMESETREALFNAQLRSAMAPWEPQGGSNYNPQGGPGSGMPGW